MTLRASIKDIGHGILGGLAVFALVIAGTVFVDAQVNGVDPYNIVSPTGEEQIGVQNAGSLIASIKLRQARDAAGFSKQAPLTGTTIVVGNDVSRLQLTPAGTIAALTVEMPPAPVNGQTVFIFSTAQVTTLTVSANTGQTLNGNLNGQLSANTGVGYLYSTSNTTWDRIQ